MISTVTHIQATVCEVVRWRRIRWWEAGKKKLVHFPSVGLVGEKQQRVFSFCVSEAPPQWSEDAEVPSQFSRDAFTVEAKSNEGSLDTEELNRSRVECQARTVSPLQKVSGK